MSSSISFRLSRTDSIVHFQILAQTEQFRSDGEQQLQFTASNGISVISLQHPGICDDLIFVRGCDRGSDLIISTLDAQTPRFAQQYVERSLRALWEFSRYCETVYQTPVAINNIYHL